MKVTPGRRVPNVEDLELPGDYTGPHDGYCGEGRPAIFFLLPIARDPDVAYAARAIHHVCQPPHTFTEQPDGSIEIRASIGSVDPKGGPYLWHGFLDRGHSWREV